MTFLVPLVLVGLAVVVALIVAFATQKRVRPGAKVATAAVAAPRVLIHAINDDRCTGCDACVAVCPTNVLDLVENKSRVLRFEDCIQCEACMWACPTTALVMHPEGSPAPAYKMPDLDANYQTKVPGQYLIGEVAGKPLVKNAANLGRAVVEHMLANGLRPSPAREAGGVLRVDVAIVGSGPGGLSAALSCVQRGLSYVVIEKENLVASTVARYPKGKLVMAEPYESANLSLLPVFDSSKEELVPIWRDLIELARIKLKMGETVEKVSKRADGGFDVRSNVAAYQAQRVVLATGLRGKPRTLGVTGENLPKVFSLLDDPDPYRGEAVCVVGGGDSALEAAMALADAGARVLLTYRGKSFSRAQPKNRQAVEQAEAQRRIKIKYESEVVEIAGDSITLQMRDGTQKRYPNQAAFVLIGADPPIQWLATMGIHFVERPHMFALPKSDDLVRRLVADAVACPADADGAYAVLQGRAVADAAPRESRAKKFIRSATGMFSASKLDKPMPLSEFAKQRRHDGRGRRDGLEPRERTRVLRMLRDDGGRLADEDSKLYVIERSDRSGVALVEESSPSIRRAARSSPPPHAPGFDPVRTLHDEARPPRPSFEGPAPKPAVIVGLARAAAQGPRGAGAKRPSRPAPVAQIFEEPTRQLDPVAAARLLDGTEEIEVPDFTSGLVDDESTNQVRIAATGGARPKPRLPPPSSHRVHEEPTRVGSLSEVEWDLDG